MDNNIQAWIDEYQKGKSGIYPYQVALLVCGKFGILLKDALNEVVAHIDKVMSEERTGE